MKYNGPPMDAIFFMTSFNRDRGGYGPLAPPLDLKLHFLGVQPIRDHDVGKEVAEIRNSTKSSQKLQKFKIFILKNSFSQIELR